MKIRVGELTDLSIQAIRRCGIDDRNASAISRNVIAAEYFGKRSHGLVSCMLFKRYSSGWQQPTGEPEVRQFTSAHYVDGNLNSGHLVMAQAVEEAACAVIAHSEPVRTIFCSQMQSTVGFAGHYARIAAEKGLGYVAFQTCFGGMTWDDAPEVQLSTNPFVIASPLHEEHCILDTSCAEESWSAVYLEKLLRGDDDDNFSVPSMSGKKGAAISIAIETIVASFTGTKYFDSKSNRHLGALVFIINGHVMPGYEAIDTGAHLSDRVRLPGSSDKRIADLEDERLELDVDERLIALVEHSMND